MSKLRFTAVCALALAFLAAAAPAQAKSGKGRAPEIDTSTLLVKFAPAATTPGARVNALGDVAAGTTGGVTVVRIQHGEDVHAKLAQYAKRGDVVYAEPNHLRRADTLPTPGDPLFGAQWGLISIDALDAWTEFPGAYAAAGGVPIAVVDTGVDSSHPDLVGKVATATGAVCLGGAGTCSSSSAVDDEGHGTHVAGIAGAQTGNGLGGAGVAFNSPIIPVKALDSTGSGWDSDIAAGITWAVNHGARVINLSLGGPGGSTTLCNAVDYAVSNGAVVVAAAGNEGVATPSYPAACAGAIGVAATDRFDQSADFSNFGSPDVFLSAPGVDIESTIFPGGGYASLTGTSMASPFVAGVAALLVSQLPSRGTAAVKNVLASTARKIGADFYPGHVYGADPYGTCIGCTWHDFYGYGLVDPVAALAVLAPRITTAIPLHALVGQQVTLTGVNFAGATSVTLAGVAAPFTLDSPTQITATVPDTGIPVGHWRVVTGAGVSVYDPTFAIDPPSISALSASRAIIGQQVTISGVGFVSVTAVTLGGLATSFHVDSQSQITATVPDPKVTQARWRVVNAYGTGTFDPLFTIDPIPAPVISSLSASHGIIGDPIVLTGSNFSGASSVTLGGLSTTFTVDSPTQITAIVADPGIAQARWRVTTAGGTAVFDPLFTIDPKPVPTIASLSASHATLGQQVVLTGANFTGATAVTLGGQATTFTLDSATQVTATVPDAHVLQARWRVTTRYGTGVFDPLFTIDPPVITSLSATHAAVGTQVTLTGIGFVGVTAVTFGGASTSFHVDSPTQVTATVPNAGVAQARWRVVNFYGTGVYDPLFTVDVPAVPSITSLSVSHAPLSAPVVLTGTSFDSATAVTFGGAKAQFTIDSPTQITASVPNAGVAQARWRVVNASGTGVFDPLFTVDPPLITATNPTHARVGTQVVLTGLGFVGVTSVTFGGAPAAFHVDSPTQLTATLPNAGVAQARWRVANAYGTGVLDPLFVVDP